MHLAPFLDQLSALGWDGPFQSKMLSARATLTHHPTHFFADVAVLPIHIHYYYKLSLFVNFYMGVCLVEDWGFCPGGVHSHFLPHNLYSFSVHIVGTPGEVSAPGQLSGFHQAAQKSFSGAFQNSNPNFHFYCLPHQHISIFKNQAPSKVKCHRTAFCRDQTVTERPVRPRVSAPATVEILAYVFMCHTPVTLIK